MSEGKEAMKSTKYSEFSFLLSCVSFLSAATKKKEDKGESTSGEAKRPECVSSHFQTITENLAENLKIVFSQTFFSKQQSATLSKIYDCV